MTPRKSHPIKEKAVNSLAEKIKNAKTLMVVSIKGLPSKQFQDIKKSLREYALVKVAKKNILRRAIEKLNKKSILPLEDYIEENNAFAISNLEGFELAGILANKKTPINAKAGQESPDNIEVKAGPTDLVPGPAISELGSVGLRVAVENGKLSIKKSKVIVKKGQTITETVASILQKLHIQPFTAGLEPLALYDVKKEKIYTDIKINPEEAKENIKTAAGKALGFAQKIVYYCKETIGYLLAKANANAEHLNKLQPKEEKEEEIKPEEKEEEKKIEEAEKESKGEEEKEEPVERNKTEENKPEAKKPAGEIKEEKKEETKPKEEKENE